MENQIQSENFFQSINSLKPIINTNGLSNDTLKQITHFQKGISHLQTIIKPEIIFEYIEYHKKSDGVSEKTYEQLDLLKQFQTGAISNETPIITAQIKKNCKNENSEIDEKVFSDTINKIKSVIIANKKSSFPLGNMAISDSAKMLEKFPNLKVLAFFNWVSAEDYFELSGKQKTGQNSLQEDEQLH